MSHDHWYRGYGLTFRAEVELPEFVPCAATTADVQVRLSSPLQVPPESSSLSALEGGAYRLVLQDIGVFDVRAGNELIVTPSPSCDPGLLRMFLIGSAMGLLFLQRGQLVIHGAGIVAKGQARIFVGESGAGKSTLSAHLGARGFAILADDTIPLVDLEGVFHAWPGSRLFKLWRDALEGLHMPIDALESVGNRADKYYAANPSVVEDKPHPVCEIIELAQGEGPPTLEPLHGLAALRTVSANAYRPEYVTVLEQHSAHFQRIAAVAGGLRVLKLTRPWETGRIGETIDLLDAHWSRT